MLNVSVGGLPEHALVQQVKAHPLGDDNVDLVDRQRHVLHLIVYNRDHVLQVVGAHDRPRQLADAFARLDGVHVLGASLGREQREERGTRADV